MTGYEQQTAPSPSQGMTGSTNVNACRMADRRLMGVTLDIESHKDNRMTEQQTSLIRDRTARRDNSVYRFARRRITLGPIARPIRSKNNSVPPR
jgi:hypothetical protein